MVSVVIPLYNKEKYIKRAIDSVLSQTMGEFEVVVVDDGSKDSGADVVSSIIDFRVRLIKKENGGASSARNRGIKEAKYDLIAFLDADDAWMPDFLETVVNLSDEYPGAGIYATAYKVKDNHGFRNIKYKDIPAGDWKGIIPDFFATMLGAPPVCSTTAVVQKKVFDDVGLFNEGERIAEDVEMWCRIALKYKIAFDNKVGAIYYQDADDRVYVVGASTKKADFYLKTLNDALLLNELLEGTKNNIRNLIEIIHVGYVVSLIFINKKKEARDYINNNKFSYQKRKVKYWYYISFLPVNLINFLMYTKRILCN